MGAMRWAGCPRRSATSASRSDDAGVCAGAVRRRRRARPGPRIRCSPVAVQQLSEYFDGARTEFDLPLAVRGGTGFERAVWDQIADIGYGEMRTYGEIATALGDPGAARAVGTACNRNPLPIVVPCHRVVGAGRQAGRVRRRPAPQTVPAGAGGPRARSRARSVDRDAERGPARSGAGANDGQAQRLDGRRR